MKNICFYELEPNSLKVLQNSSNTFISIDNSINICFQENNGILIFAVLSSIFLIFDYINGFAEGICEIYLNYSLI